MSSSLLDEFPVIVSVGPDTKSPLVTWQDCRRCNTNRWMRGIGIEDQPYLKCVACGWTRPDPDIVDWFRPARGSRRASKRDKRRTLRYD